jgi:hypothetical protein
MPSVREAFGDGKAIAASDLTPGQPLPLTIQSAELIEFDDGNKLKLCFSNYTKPLICNKTNGNRLAELHGDDFGHWAGKSFDLIADKTEFQGKLVDCVRVSMTPTTLPLTPTTTAINQSPAQAASLLERAKGAYANASTAEELLAALTSIGDWRDSFPSVEEYKAALNAVTAHAVRFPTGWEEVLRRLKFYQDAVTPAAPVVADKIPF